MAGIEVVGQNGANFILGDDVLRALRGSNGGAGHGDDFVDERRRHRRLRFRLEARGGISETIPPPPIWRYLSTENCEKDECGFCVVCQSEYEEGEELGKLRCGHSYHAPCIHTWLLKKNACPLCNQTAIPELQSLG